jgi:hypothetical protein
MAFRREVACQIYTENGTVEVRAITFRRSSPPDNIQNDGRPGGMPLISALARTMASAF